MKTIICYLFIILFISVIGSTQRKKLTWNQSQWMM